MNPALRLGIELPPVPATVVGRSRAGAPWAQAGNATATAGSGLGAWWRIADAGLRAGATGVWLTDGRLDTRDAEPGGQWCDACTLAAGLAVRVDDALIGVVSPVPSGRHPSMLARDVTTLDVLSGGRAAVRLEWDAPAPTDRAVASEHLADAVAVCAAMLRGGDPTYDGRHFHVSGALNRPAPRQAGGPPILVAAPPEITADLLAAGRRPGAALAQARSMAVVADAVVCEADPPSIAAWRTALDGSKARNGVGEGPPALVCRATAANLGSGSPRSVGAQAHDAGADGIVVRVPTPRRHGDAPLATALAALAGELYSPWAAPS